MYSKVTIARHPVHPMLVAFPVAFYTATVVAFLVFFATVDAFWWRVGFIANLAGVLTALLAAIPGFIDWSLGVPDGSPAKKTGLKHMMCNVAALALFAVNLVLTWDQWERPMPDTNPLVLVLPILGILLTIAAGFLGWKMVQDYHVGVALTPEQEQLEPSDPAKAHQPHPHPHAHPPVPLGR